MKTEKITWYSIKEKLPSAGEKILTVSDGNKERVFIHDVRSDNLFNRKKGESTMNIGSGIWIKYWAKLPESPYN